MSESLREYRRFGARGLFAFVLALVVLAAVPGLLVACSPREGAVPAAAPPASAAARPNLLLIIADDQAWTDFGFMGHAQIRTPRLDQLAEEGLRYTRGYVPHSVCRPSLATLATGLYPHQHGIATNWPPGTEPGGGFDAEAPAAAPPPVDTTRFDSAPKLAAILGEHGYRTFQAGKWWEGDYRRGGFAQGTDDPADAYSIGRATVEPVTDFMRESRDAGAPFFAWVAPLLPHGPHDPPERLAQHYRGKAPPPIARYQAMCERLDEMVGDLLDFLDREGLAENTLVVFLSDNGWVTRGRNPSPVRSKLTPYEGGVRTPILLRWPGHAPVRENGRDPVSSVDIAPTLLRAAGIAPPARMPGVDLLDVRAVQQRGRVFGEIFERVARSVTDPAASLRYRFVVEGAWKLILPNPALLPEAPVELFNLSIDPHERVNLAPDLPQRVETLTAALDAWWDPTREGDER